jgi:hypothetical protein
MPNPRCTKCGSTDGVYYYGGVRQCQNCNAVQRHKDDKTTDGFGRPVLQLVKKQETQKAWGQIEMIPFRQDVSGCILEDGTEYPPTFKWFSRIRALRTDGENFCVEIVIENDQVVDGKVSLEFMQTKIANSLLTLETFRVCACAAGKLCKNHAL